MVEYRYPIIARAGWPFIFVVLVGATAVQISGGTLLAAPLWVLTLLLFYLLRDPRRTVPSAPLAVVAPVDGQVFDIATMQDSFIDREAVRLRLHKGSADLYAVRSPIEGKVQNQWLGRDAEFQDNAVLTKGCFAQWVRSDEGDDQVTVIHPDWAFNRLRCYVHSGERIGQGQRCGWLPFSATVDVYLPANARIEVKCGEKVLAGSSILATLVH